MKREPGVSSTLEVARRTDVTEDDSDIGQMCSEVFGPGWQHLRDPDLEGLLARIVAAGGKQRMPMREYFPGKKPYLMVYVEDPSGIVFEIYCHSYAPTYSAGAYT